MAGINLFGENLISDKKTKLILVFFIVCLVVFISTLSYSGFFEKERRNAVLRQKFSGKIINIKTPPAHHGDKFVQLSDSTKMRWYFPKQKFDILVGDSLVKKKKTLYLDVYRNNVRVIKIDMLNE